MERIGIMEMQQIDAAIRTRGWKQNTLLTFLQNDFSKPIGKDYVMVFLRSTPIQIVPVELVDDIKRLSHNGFMYDHMERQLVCLVDVTSTEGEVLGGDIIGLLDKWINENIKNDGN